MNNPKLPWERRQPWFVLGAIVLTMVAAYPYFSPGFSVRSAPSVSPVKFAAGKELFLREWSINDPIAEGDGLGPVFNGTSCAECHSLGGLVISAVAEALPAHLRHLVYVTAFLPRDGDSLVRICSVDPDNPLNSASVRTPDGQCVTVDPERIREIFYADCPAADLALAKTRLGPEPLAVMFQTVHVTPERFGRVPRTYIHCSRDVALPLFVQELMVAASPCGTVLTLPTGHSPFFAAPQALAAQLGSLPLA